MLDSFLYPFGIIGIEPEVRINSPAVYGWVADIIKFAGGRSRPFGMKNIAKRNVVKQLTRRTAL
jgi:hypothetical protein